MNATQWQHTLIAALIQLACGYWMGWWQAGAFATGIFFAREYAQVEYKVRARTGRSLTDMMPWHVFRREYWTLDAMLDWLLPAGCCAVVAYFMVSVL